MKIFSSALFTGLAAAGQRPTSEGWSAAAEGGYSSASCKCEIKCTPDIARYCSKTASLLTTDKLQCRVQLLTLFKRNVRCRHCCRYRYAVLYGAKGEFQNLPIWKSRDVRSWRTWRNLLSSKKTRVNPFARETANWVQNWCLLVKHPV